MGGIDHPLGYDPSQFDTGVSSVGQNAAPLDAVMPGLGTSIKMGADIVGGIGNTISGWFGGGGGSKQQSGYTLPPEYELQYLQNFQQQQQQMQQAYGQISDAYNAYSSKITTLNDIIGGGPNQEKLKALQASNFQLGQSLGMSAQDLAKNGFLTNQDQKDMEQMQQLAQSHGQGYNNPALEGQIAAQKRQMDASMSAQGIPAAQRAIALAQFEQSANEQRYQGAQEQFGMMGSLIGQRAGLRQQGYGQATNTYGMNQGMAGSMLGALGQNYAGQYAGQSTALELQAALRGEQQNAFTTLGQFKLSNTTKNFLAGGGAQQWGGPGNYYQQTGVPKSQTGNWMRGITGQQQYEYTGGPEAARASLQNAWATAQNALAGNTQQQQPKTYIPSMVPNT